MKRECIGNFIMDWCSIILTPRQMLSITSLQNWHTSFSNINLTANSYWFQRYFILLWSHLTNSHTRTFSYKLVKALYFCARSGSYGGQSRLFSCSSRGSPVSQISFYAYSSRPNAPVSFMLFCFLFIFKANSTLRMNSRY